jgi:MFS transporter, Spinster family, sphingosine-1-phosphate transporter
MHDLPLSDRDGYLSTPRAAWFAFAMSVALMVFDYVDRQVIVSLFPHLKAEWGLSDVQLGALVSAISLTVALFGIPVALIADRFSRVKSIVVMATVWSLATISCMFTRNYGQLLAARSLVGLGEAGYGSVAPALLAGHFPSRLRGTLMAGFFASASVGSVLGVMLGGIIAAQWGWKAAFGVVGFPGLVLALAYLFVRDYRTVDLTPKLDAATRSTRAVASHIVKVLARSRTMLWICIGGPAQVIVISTVWAWLPSYLNRVHHVSPKDAGVQAALVVLCGAIGSVVWGWWVDRADRSRPAAKLQRLALLCLATMIVLGAAFGAPLAGIALAPKTQFALIALGGFLMTCTAGPVAAIVMDVTHPGVRSTGASVLSLFQNLFGLALCPVITGALSDALGLETALAIMPAFGVVAIVAMLMASRTYAADVIGAAVLPDAAGDAAAQRPALA